MSLIKQGPFAHFDCGSDCDITTETDSSEREVCADCLLSDGACSIHSSERAKPDVNRKTTGANLSVSMPLYGVGVNHAAAQIITLTAERDAALAEVERLTSERDTAVRIAQAAHRFACDFETPCTPENCELTAALAGDPKTTISEKIMVDDLAKVTAQAGQLAAALEDYGRHGDDCIWQNTESTPDNGPCDCGLVATIAAWKESRA